LLNQFQSSLIYINIINIYYLSNVNCTFIGLLANIGVRNIRHLTPRCKKFYSINNQLIRKQRQTDVKKELFKNRSRRAEKIAGSYIIKKLNRKVTTVTSLFTKLQLRETMKKKKGLRFTLEEKMLSLSIYKRSPKGYRLLSNLFTLPCKRTLNNLPSTVSIGPGVSAHHLWSCKF